VKVKGGVKTSVKGEESHTDSDLVVVDAMLPETMSIPKVKTHHLTANGHETKVMVIGGGGGGERKDRMISKYDTIFTLTPV